MRSRPRSKLAYTRFRPVLMTALAMIIGMAPMALGLGEGGEQNAPLGRAVIGGLLFATCATLLFVPVVFSLVHGERGSPGRRDAIRPPDEWRSLCPLIRSRFSPRLLRRLKLAGIVGGRASAGDRDRRIATRLYGEPGRRRNGQTAQADPDRQRDQPSLATNGRKRARSARQRCRPFTTHRSMRACPAICMIWYKDIGAQVHKGDVLGVIDTPELDQQIEQAKGDLANAVAAETAVADDRQTLDQPARRSMPSPNRKPKRRRAISPAKTALVTAAKANLDRLEALKDFARITAPFDGMVTSRSVDIGALINAGADSSAYAALHGRRCSPDPRLCQTFRRTIRREIRPGLTATLTLAGISRHGPSPRRSIPRRNAISEQSNALLVELLADNAGRCAQARRVCAR